MRITIRMIKEIDYLLTTVSDNLGVSKVTIAMLALSKYLRKLPSIPMDNRPATVRYALAVTDDTNKRLTQVSDETSLSKNALVNALTLYYIKHDLRYLLDEIYPLHEGKGN